MGFLFLIICHTLALAVQPDLKTLPIGLAPGEEFRTTNDAPLTAPPIGPIRSLAEWEVSNGVMVLWPNPSLIRALQKHGPVYLFADSSSEKNWWRSWLTNNSISTPDINYFVTPTDSIWIRDYGPWFILDGNNDIGIVDTKYNRPRPLDDVVPLFLAKELGIPFYQPGLVHTGGNYYNDAYQNAFSSTLVFSENSGLGTAEIFNRMFSFLGVQRYTTSRLSPGTTIQHLDTFGKLVSPDTWVFSNFPAGSQHKADSDNMVKLLSTLKSPYGTPYKIYRMKMTPTAGGDFRAYLNSFISNGVLYYPTYGDSADTDTRKVFEAALPGYEVVGVDAMGTTWGDSVHCRTRNLLTRDAIFLFPTIQQLIDPGKSQLGIDLEAIPSPGAALVEAPILHWTLNGVEQANRSFDFSNKNYWKLRISGLKTEDAVALWISARDSRGVERSEPRRAPRQLIEIKIANARI